MAYKKNGKRKRLWTIVRVLKQMKFNFSNESNATAVPIETCKNSW